MAKYSLDELYRDALRSIYFKNDPEGGLRKLKRLQETLDASADGDTPLMFRVPARILLLEERFTDAKAQAEAGLLFFDEDADLILILATAEINLGHTEEAVKIIDEALKYLKDDRELAAIAYLLRGDVWGREKKFDLQIEEYKKALQMHEKFPLVYELMGHCHLESGRPDLARDAFRHALSYKVPMPWSHLGLGIALKNLGDMRGAITEFYRVIEGDGGPEVKYRAYRNLASCYYRKRELAEARKFYAKALEFVPRDVATLCDLTVVCIESGEYSDASDFLNMALKQALSGPPTVRETLTKGLANVRSIAGNDTVKAFLRDKRITEDPLTHAMAYLYLGILFESQEKYRDAKTVLDRAVEIFERPKDRHAEHAREARRRLEDLEHLLEELFEAVEKEPRKKRKGSEKPPYVNFSRFRRLSLIRRR